MRTREEQPDRAAASQTLRHVDQLRGKWPKFGTFIDKEVKRRADVVGIFPDEASIVRLIGAGLLEANDESQAQNRHMQTEPMAGLITATIKIEPIQIITEAELSGTTPATPQFPPR